MFVPFERVWSGFNHTSNSGKRRIRHSWNYSHNVGISPNLSISTRFLIILLKNNKHEDIVLLIANYFISLVKTFLQQREKVKWRSAKACNFFFFFFLKGVESLFRFWFQLQRKFKQSRFTRSETGLDKRNTTLEAHIARTR